MQRTLLSTQKSFSFYFTSTYFAYAWRDGQAELTAGGWLNAEMVQPQIKRTTSLIPAQTRPDLEQVH